MTVLFHPDFAQDILQFETEYAKVSLGLAVRFRSQIDFAIAEIIRSPGSAGSYLQCDSKIIKNLRRRNLRDFPFFILYGAASDQLVLGSVIPTRSDPLTWLARFAKKDSNAKEE